MSPASVSVESFHAGPSSAPLKNPAAPRYDVVALRVAFQQDSSRFTTGNGTFDGPLFETLSPSVDPLPHDAGYFDAHLQYLANYVAHVSNGRTVIDTHLIPEVIQVSQPMGAYSPTGLESDSDQEIVKLARLVQEAWTLAGSQSSFDMSGFDPETTVLVLFHAGVGRDIELVGTTLDKTPEDLPTIFFNESSLTRLLPESISFKGFPVNHTLLMPRTETRQGFDFIQDQPFLVEFSINGLLAASFLNFLGAPDLFDTKTGESAIGPFGLMDPLGLFAYNGLFAPQPSAWTRYYLGWSDPVELAGDETVSATLDAVSGPDATRELARVAISSSEFFLVENRHRDIAGDGLLLTVYRDGQHVQQQFQNGQEDFNSLTIDAFEGGVVVDVDDYDWALPGGIDEDGNALLGGILIWHVDENIIREGMPANSVNADPNRRGVDLEEADSAQDLGFPSGNIFAPQSHLGSPFDFYYEGNPVVVITRTGEEVRLYQNRFGTDTFPNSNTNAGGPSFVTIEDFSAQGASMGFTVRREAAEGIAPVDEYPSGEEAQIPDDSYLAPYSEAGVVFRSAANEARIAVSGTSEVRAIRANGISSPVALPDGRVAMLVRGEDPLDAAVLLVDDDGEIAITLDVVSTAASETRSHLLYDAASSLLYALYPNDAGAVIYEVDPSQRQSRLIPSREARLFSIASAGADGIAQLTAAGVFRMQGGDAIWPFSIDVDEGPGRLVLGKDRSGLVGAFTLVNSNVLVYLQADGGVNLIDVSSAEPQGGVLSSYPILLDIDGDGTLEVLVAYGRSLLAYTAGGGLADGFPIEVPAHAATQPLAASMEGYPGWTLFVAAEDGYVYALSLRSPGRQVEGFPLTVGNRISTTPLLHGKQFIAIDERGKMAAWEVEGLGAIWWGQQHGNASNTSYVELQTVEPPAETSELLVSGEIYNWPNPIRDSETFFRLTPTQDVRATITIIDAAGLLIDEIVVENVAGNTATDVRWRTDAVSGVYYARIEAVTDAGDRETKMVKLAIIR